MALCAKGAFRGGVLACFLQFSKIAHAHIGTCVHIEQILTVSPLGA